MTNKSSGAGYTVQQWLHDSADVLAELEITSARLDAEIILAHTLRRSRTWLHAHGDEKISPREFEIADARLALRRERTPVAYIIGHREFYGRLFKVSPSVLIPRPESESIITLLAQALQGLTLQNYNSFRLVDVGTGSGCLGITAKLEFPKLDVTLADISRHALTVAEENARLLDANVNTVKSDLLNNLSGFFTIILANLPYVDDSWQRSPETDHEPSLALFAKSGGLDLIYKLIEQADRHLSIGGYLILEADPRQHADIIQFAESHELKHIVTNGFVLSFTRVS